MSNTTNSMAAWILSQNPGHDVVSSPELALLAGMSLSQVLAVAAHRPVVVAEDDAPVSGVAPTYAPAARPARAA